MPMAHRCDSGQAPLAMPKGKQLAWGSELVVRQLHAPVCYFFECPWMSRA